VSSGSAPADVRGPIVTPDQEGFDLARQAFNLAVDQQPAAVAMPVDAEDVAATVRYARGQGLRIAPQTTGHNPRPLGDLGEFLLLKTSALKDVEIDAGSRTARVGSGVQWKDIVPTCSDTGTRPSRGATTRSATTPPACATCSRCWGSVGWPWSATRSGAGWRCSSPTSSPIASGAWCWSTAAGWATRSHCFCGRPPCPAPST